MSFPKMCSPDVLTSNSQAKNEARPLRQMPLSQMSKTTTTRLLLHTHDLIAALLTTTKMILMKRRTHSSWKTTTVRPLNFLQNSAWAPIKTSFTTSKSSVNYLSTWRSVTRKRGKKLRYHYRAVCSFKPSSVSSYLPRLQSSTSLSH